VWLNRGLLAERLVRNKMAEQAYRRVIAKSFSLIAWSRLLEFYTEANKLQGAVACIAEVLDDFTEKLGIKKYQEGLPEWIDEALCKLISKNGAEAVKLAFEREYCIQNSSIMKAIAEAECRKVRNYNMKPAQVQT